LKSKFLRHRVQHDRKPRVYAGFNKKLNTLENCCLLGKTKVDSYRNRLLNCYQSQQQQKISLIRSFLEHIKAFFLRWQNIRCYYIMSFPFINNILNDTCDGFVLGSNKTCCCSYVSRAEDVLLATPIGIITGFLYGLNLYKISMNPIKKRPTEQSLKPRHFLVFRYRCNECFCVICPKFDCSNLCEWLRGWCQSISSCCQSISSCCSRSISGSQQESPEPSLTERWWFDIIGKL
jgi:hypothetical protein